MSKLNNFKNYIESSMVNSLPQSSMIEIKFGDETDGRELFDWQELKEAKLVEKNPMKQEKLKPPRKIKIIDHTYFPDSKYDTSMLSVSSEEMYDGADNTEDDLTDVQFDFSEDAEEEGDLVSEMNDASIMDDSEMNLKRTCKREFIPYNDEVVNEKDAKYGGKSLCKMTRQHEPLTYGVRGRVLAHPLDVLKCTMCGKTFLRKNMRVHMVSNAHIAKWTRNRVKKMREEDI